LRFCSPPSSPPPRLDLHFDTPRPPPLRVPATGSPGTGAGSKPPAPRPEATLQAMLQDGWVLAVLMLLAPIMQTTLLQSRPRPGEGDWTVVSHRERGERASPKEIQARIMATPTNTL